MGVTAPDITQIPMSSELATTLARGAEFASATGATEVSLEHLLAALCDDPDAAAVLDASQISGERIKSDVIARILETAQAAATPQDSLGVSVEVRRILEAAAAAARGSRRRDINGAIVLAAIVGDARSVAAEILETHGLTFENAIRALQAALTPREAPAPQPQQPPVADDVLARARERVQSRSAPSLRDIMKDMPRPAPLEPSGTLSAAPSTNEPLPEATFPERPQPENPVPEPPLPQSPSFGSSAWPNAQAQEEALDPSHAFETGPATEPPRPEPEATDASSGPARPFHPHEPQLPSGRAPESLPRTEPSFGTPIPASRPAHDPASGAAPSPFPREPSLPLPPSRPAPYPGAGSQPQEPHGFPSSPSAAAPPPAAAGPGAQHSGGAPASPRGMFNLPPRPQPSSVQPPPIPAPGLGGPGPAHARPAGPAPSGSPQFGPRGPSLSPSGPGGAPPMTAPGAAPTPTSHPSLGPDVGFRPGAPTRNQSAQPQAAAPQAQRRAPKRTKGTNVETGQLAENIPRSMRVGKTMRAEIRIAKASVKALTEGVDGGGQVWQHTVAISKAMSVRLRAPDGGFFIESTSPETQWIESNLGYASDDFASWRFNITPQYRGWSDLQIIVSARTVGADGVAAETALPDQIVEVKVRANIGRAFVRLLGWTVAAVIGGALATFGESGMTIVTALMKKFGH